MNGPNYKQDWQRILKNCPHFVQWKTLAVNRILLVMMDRQANTFSALVQLRVPKAAETSATTEKRRKKEKDDCMMRNIKAFIEDRSVLIYFILTFVLSWGGVLVLGAPHGMPTTSEQFERLYPIVFLPYLLGPVISSLVLISLIDGRAGLRTLLSRLVKWRVSVRWYAVATLTAPLLTLGVLGALSLKSTAFLPAIFTTDDKLSLILTGIGIGLIGGGVMEEPGWTGFAIPRLRERHSVRVTGLVVGFLWGVWHFLPTYWGSGDSSGVLSLSLLVPPLFFYVTVLPAYRVILVWVFDRTESLLVVILMHASLTASTLFVLAPSVEGVPLLVYYLVLAVLLWLLVAVIWLQDAA